MSADDRCGRVLGEMQRAGLDALVAVCGDVHAFQQPNAVMLLGGFRAVGNACMLLRADGESELVVTPSWEAGRAAARAVTSGVRGSDDFHAAVADSLRRLTLPPERIGVVGLDTLGYADACWLTELIGTPGRRFDAEFFAVTRTKSAAEIDNAVEATRIALQGYARLLELARPGVTELELATRICAAMAEEGAEDNFLMLSAGPHSRAVRPPGSRPLERGDLILCEISPCFGGQFSQICRTAVVGPVAALLSEKYALLQEAFRRGMQAAVPGARVAELVAAINAGVIEAGYGEFCAPPHMRARGHGLGFGSIAPGDLSAGSTAVIEADMVFVIHPNQYMPETGYMMCGDPVVVTGDGARNLSERPATLDQIRA
jgi:Xaa-Pro aminopeptidase